MEICSATAKDKSTILSTFSPKTDSNTIFTCSKHVSSFAKEEKDLKATELPQIASTHPSAGIDEQNKPFRGQQRTLGMPVSVVYKVLFRNIFSIFLSDIGRL